MIEVLSCIMYPLDGGTTRSIATSANDMNATDLSLWGKRFEV